MSDEEESGKDMGLGQKIELFENIVVYGAGEYGKVVTRWLQEQNETKGKNIVVSVSKKSNIKFLNGYSLCEINELDVLPSQSMVIIAVAEDKREAVIETIGKYGFLEYAVIGKYWYTHMKNVFLLADRTEMEKLQEKSIAYSQEIIWGQNLDRVLKNSLWCKRTDFKTGGAAIDNHSLYTLYKLLDSGKFKNVLDIGMGQSSKLIGQYVKFNQETKHVVVEDDADWIEFATRELELGDNSEIKQLDCYMREEDGVKVRVYDSFKEELQSERFDLISVDGPKGYDLQYLSRVDILELLPQCLKESWVIMIDDTERLGEANTVMQIESILIKNGMKYAVMEHVGIKNFTILTSWDNRFFCTV